jgi:copper chaperone CopZ
MARRAAPAIGFGLGLGLGLGRVRRDSKNCANAVSTAIQAMPGIAEAAFDLAAGQVSVSADPQPGRQTLAGAVAKAGYTLRP